MSFHEKRIWAMLAANVLVYGWYFSTMVDIAASNERPITTEMFAWNLVTAVVLLIVIAIVSHIVIAIHGAASEGEVDENEDERDKLIRQGAESKGGSILALGVVVTIGMILFGNGPFVTANALLAALILSETVAGVFKLIDYRSSF